MFRVLRSFIFLELAVRKGASPCDPKLRVDDTRDAEFLAERVTARHRLAERVAARRKRSSPRLRAS